MMKAASMNSQSPKNSYNLRIFLLLSALSVFIVLIMFRLFHLAVVNHGYYQQLADNQHSGIGTILPKRGEIYLSSFAQGTPLLVATNVIEYTVYATPKTVQDANKTAKMLAPFLEMDLGVLTQDLLSSSNYVVLKKQVTEETGKKIQNLKLVGIGLEPAEDRFYPEKNLASQVLGFLGYKGEIRAGQYGVEGKYNEQLGGQQGIQGTQKDAAGRLISTSSSTFVPAQDGDDIYLTLDPAIQLKAQAVLQKAVTDHRADGGSVVIMDPKTGKVLAMASYPDFDPNNYGKVSDLSIFSNKVLSADYEPGSVFKAITLAAAINDGKITPETIYENTGSVQVDDKVIKNSDPTAFLGQQNMISVLDESLNTGVVFAEQQMGNDSFKKYVEKFGFGKLVDFDLAGQTAGNIKNLNQRGDVFFATAAFGQGITVSPLQLVQAYSALANGGKMMTPYIISKIVHPDGSIEEIEPKGANQILDAKTAAAVSGMLVDVVENGHGKKAAVKGYYIAGKTGTAQVAYTDRAGYDPNRNIGSFIGYGPVDDPKFLMLVRIDNPRDVKFAESTAAPSFGEIASFLLSYLQVAPSRQ